MIEFPAETYTVGTKNLVIFIPVVVTSMAISGYAVLPVFYENGIFNVFTVRILSVLFYIFSTCTAILFST